MIGSRLLARVALLLGALVIGMVVEACAPLPASEPRPRPATDSPIPTASAQMMPTRGATGTVGPATDVATSSPPSQGRPATPTASLPAVPTSQTTLALTDYEELLTKAAAKGHVLVIVQLALPTGPFVPEGALSETDAQAQRAAIASTREALIASLSGLDVTVYASWDATPAVGMKVDEAALREIIASPYALSIQEDALSSTQ